MSLVRKEPFLKGKELWRPPFSAVPKITLPNVKWTLNQKAFAVTPFHLDVLKPKNSLSHDLNPGYNIFTPFRMISTLKSDPNGMNGRSVFPRWSCGDGSACSSISNILNRDYSGSFLPSMKPFSGDVTFVSPWLHKFISKLRHSMVPLFVFLVSAGAVGAALLLVTYPPILLQRWFEKKICSIVSQSLGVYVSFDRILRIDNDGSKQYRFRKIVARRDASMIPSDSNATLFDLTVEAIDVRISFLHWLIGKGWITDMNINGLRGTLSDSDCVSETEVVPPTVSSSKWCIDKLKLDDGLIYLLRKDARSIPIEIHALSSNHVHGAWILRDLLMSETATGLIDGRLFSLRSLFSQYSADGDPVAPDQRQLDIHDLSLPLVSGMGEGPVTWITNGTADVKVMIKKEVSKGLLLRFVVVLKDVHAGLPATGDRDLSVVNASIIRPVLAYMNNNSTRLPVSFNVYVSDQSFENACQPGDIQLFDRIADALTSEFARIIDTKKREKAKVVAGFVNAATKGVTRGISRWIQRLWQHTFYLEPWDSYVGLLNGK